MSLSAAGVTRSARDLIAEVDARGHQCRDRGMNLTAAQSERAGGERTGAGVRGKHIRSRAPGQVIINAATELVRQELPLHSFGRGAKRGHSHVGAAPTRADGPLRSRFAQSCGAARSADDGVSPARTAAMKPAMRGVIDLLRRDALRAGVTRQTGEPDALPTLGQLRQQRAPTWAQRRLARRSHRFETTRSDRGQEVGADIGKALRSEPDSDRVDARKLRAEDRQVERNTCGASPRSLATRVTAERRSRSRLGASSHSASTPSTDCRVGGQGRGASGYCRYRVWVCSPGWVSGSSGWPRVDSGRQEVTPADIREDYHKANGTCVVDEYSRSCTSQ